MSQHEATASVSEMQSDDVPPGHGMCFDEFEARQIEDDDAVPFLGDLRQRSLERLAVRQVQLARQAHGDLVVAHGQHCIEKIASESLGRIWLLHQPSSCGDERRTAGSWRGALQSARQSRCAGSVLKKA